MPGTSVGPLDFILIHLVTGGSAGFLAGLLGVGGGIIIVPVLFSLFVAFGLGAALAMNLAVGTSLATIVFTSAVSMHAHRKRGAVDLFLLKSWGVGILAGAVAGSLCAKYVGGNGLIAVFGSVTFLLALNMARRNDLRIATSLPGSISINLGIAGTVGFFSALMGIGGGTLSVPTLNAFGYPVHRAVGTAAAIGLLISVPATLGFLWIGWGVPGRPDFTLGYVNLVGFLLIVPGTTLLAPVGARVAHRLDRLWLRRAFAVFLGVSALRMLSLLLRG